MTKNACAVIALIFLSACGPSLIEQQARQAEAENTSAREACERQNPDRYAKPATKRIKCINAAEWQYNLAMAKSVGHPGMDVIHLMHAQRMAVAEQFDAGKLTNAQFDMSLAQVENAANSQLQGRMNSMAAVNAAQQQAAAARQQAAMQGIAAGAAIMAPPPMRTPTNTRCTTFGNTTNCNSY